VAAGVLSVKGDLVLDEGSYADPAPGPEWPSSNQHWSDYCALSGGFTANGGCVSLFVQPTLIGQAARVRLAPEGHGAVVELDVLTVPKGATLDVKAVIGVDRIRVWGVIPMDVREWSARQAHPDPVALFGSVLKRALMIGGVEVQGEVRRERLASGGHVLATLRTPILSVLAPINTHSDNAVADQLFLMVGAAVGGGGDRAGGGEATRGALTALGLDADGIQQVDGSGLSRANRVSARHMVALLDTVIAADDAGSAAFIESLALAARTGTLADRMQGGAAALRVRAKSGFIGGTSGLSGVAMTEGGCLLVFSIFVDYPVLGGLNRGVWKPMQDAICEALVQSDGP
jgi:D-alanyl-D-alanine carboxypeptidase/D-alanyl-D-alanine-endopeptidase (penicillin-binding protein 4)